MGVLLYVIGIVCAIWCVIDIFKKNIGVLLKLVIAILVLATSWIGLAVYYFLIRNNIEKWAK